MPRLLNPSRLPALALLLLGAGYGLIASPASALSPPTDLTPQPPDTGTSQPGSPPPSGGSAIESEPLPQPDMTQPPTQAQPTQPQSAPPPLVLQPGAQPMPMPSAEQPQEQAPAQPLQPQPVATAAPQTTSIGADLGPNLWFGATPSRLMALVPQLPAPVTVPSLRDLQLRLLTTAASMPGVAPGSDPLVPLRAERLNAMGFPDAALALTQATANLPPSTPQQVVEQALTAGDTGTACNQVDGQIAKMQAPDLYWRKALIYCQLAGKQVDQAEIGLDLLREVPNPDAGTASFIAVASVAAGDVKPKSVKKIATADPVLIATMKLAGLPAPAAPGKVVPVPVGLAASVMTARNGAAAVPQRIDAGERAFAAGLIPAQELAALYQLAPAGPGDPVADLAASDSPMARAVVYKAAAVAQLPEQRARLIGAALQRARARGDYLTEVALYAPFTQQVQPMRNLAWFAPDAARVMFLVGNVERGNFWLNLVDSSTGNPDLVRAAPGLRLLARIARGGSGGQLSNDPVASWRQATGADEHKGAQVYAIFAGLGQRIGGWTGIAPITAGGSLASEINAAALAGRRGETVLTALVALGGDKVAGADPAAISSSLGGLTSVGLGAEARQVALQAAVLIGL